MPEGRLTDKTLTCKQCRRPFVFKVTEQLFFQDRGLVEPKRCPACREMRKHRGAFGKQVVSVDSKTGEVLCRRCGKPASRHISLKTGEALCTRCDDQYGFGDVDTELDDRLFYDEWEERFNVTRSNQ